MTERRTVQLILKEHMKLKSAFKGRKDNAIEKLRLKAAQLLDICCCKCVDLSNCSCSIEFKVPRIEQDFLNDQKGYKNTRKKTKIVYLLRKRKFSTILPNSSIERDGSSEDDTVRVEKDSCIERDGSSEDDTVHVEKDSCIERDGSSEDDTVRV